MRQTLNILQSVVMAHGSVTEEHAYLCTGNPTPATIESVMHCLMNENMATAYQWLHELQVRDRASVLSDPAVWPVNRGMCGLYRLCGVYVACA